MLGVRGAGGVCTGQYGDSQRNPRGKKRLGIAKAVPVLRGLGGCGGSPRIALGAEVRQPGGFHFFFPGGEFVLEFGSVEAAMGYCLYKLGCRGPETYNNCPTVKFHGGTSWPIQAGHPCLGCSEPDFWDSMTPFYKEM